MQQSQRHERKDTAQRIEHASLQELRVRRASPIPGARDAYDELINHLLHLLSDDLNQDVLQQDISASRIAIQAKIETLLAQKKIILKRHEKRQLIRDIIPELLKRDTPPPPLDKSDKPKAFYTIEDLSELSMLTGEMAGHLQEKVLAKSTIIISGQAHTGKTTLLRALCDFIPAEERIVTIEEQAELQLERENLISLQTEGNSQPPTPAVAAGKLIMTAASMRPDRIILGAIHGLEIAAWLQVINAGLRGGLTTCCAESPQELLDRIETMLTLADPSATTGAVRLLIASAIDLIVHLVRLPDNKLLVDSITEISDIKDNQFVTVDLL